MAATKTTAYSVGLDSKTIHLHNGQNCISKDDRKTDAFGSKMVFSGILEDYTFKTPFVSHKITYPLIRNSVYKFDSAYVHEFDDKSLLLIATEHTKIESIKRRGLP